MFSIDQSGTFSFGGRTVRRVGYGAMQLAGPGVFGPPKDRDAALAVLREAVASGVNHIDTSDFYGPHVTNQLIREALHPYPEDLVIVTKVGARRGADASWIPAFTPEEVTQQVYDNLRNLGLDALDIVNLRSTFDVHGPAEGSIEAPLTALAELQRKGLVRHIGLCNVTPTQIEEGRAHLQDRLRAEPLQPGTSRRRCADRRSRSRQHRVRAVFPARWFQPAAVIGALRRRSATRCHTDANGACLAAAPCPQHPSDPGHFVCRTSAREPGDGAVEVASGRDHIARWHCGEDAGCVMQAGWGGVCKPKNFRQVFLQLRSGRRLVGL